MLTLNWTSRLYATRVWLCSYSSFPKEFRAHKLCSGRVSSRSSWLYRRMFLSDLCLISTKGYVKASVVAGGFGMRLIFFSVITVF